MNNLQLKRNAVIAAQQQAKASGKRLSPNSNLLKQYRLALPQRLPFPLFLCAIGHMLGDCSLQATANTGQALLKFEWGNEAYANFVYDLFYDYILSPPRETVRINKYGNSVTTWQFQTLSHPSFMPLYYLFSTKGAKCVPAGLVRDFVEPLTLAIWYMDDGNMTDYREGHGQGVQINTQGFTVSDVERMAAELNDKYSLACWVRLVKDKGQPIICFPSHTYPIFHNLVKDYMAPCMMYKLPAPAVR
jgi:hypothetical protein